MELPGYRYTCEMMKKLRFLVSRHNRENDFQVAQAQTAEDTARKLGSDDADIPILKEAKVAYAKLQ